MSSPSGVKRQRTEAEPIGVGGALLWLLLSTGLLLLLLGRRGFLCERWLSRLLWLAWCVFLAVGDRGTHRFVSLWANSYFSLLELLDRVLSLILKLL
jgi:hypothetical protein